MQIDSLTGRDKTSSESSKSECSYESDSKDSWSTYVESSSSDTTPISSRVLPLRETRGKRIKALIGEEAVCDAEFWNHDTWEEEKYDEDWYTEDEKHYRDYADSDFFEKSSSEDSDENMINFVELNLNKEEKKQRQKPKAYIDPLKKKRTLKPRKVRPRPLPPAAACSECKPTTSNVIIPNKFRGQILSQEEHLKRAKLVELENSKKVALQTAEDSWKKTLQQKPSSSIWTGKMVLYISWASDRIIQMEDTKTTYSPKTPIESRNMTFFVNFDQPSRSSVPTEYTKRESTDKFHDIVTNEITEKYLDPYLTLSHKDVSHFKSSRIQCYSSDFASFKSKLDQIDKLLQYLLNYTKSCSLIPQFTQDTN